MATYLRDPCREQAQIEKRSRAAKVQRLVHVAMTDREVTIPALSERFGMPQWAVTQHLREHGIETAGRYHEDLSANTRSRRERRR